MDEKQNCPLCTSKKTKLFHQDRFRHYLQCSNCSLIFVPIRFHLSPEAEKRRYDHHENNPDDPGYGNFLKKLLVPLIPKLRSGAKGLDFGSGPVPVLSMLFEEHGFPLENYDPYYSNDKELLKKTYDFITCSETVEHFANPRKEWTLFLKLVEKGGWIAIMTEMMGDEVDFANWYYKADDTHICFYSRGTFEWLAEKYGLKVSFQGDSVALFRV
ncbi:MAG: class I SAM-dependent methyltransferase [Proteobacteria bacterium]|nr:class I SAM-dependent methyltransferase [Pseudomonadota bacterium]